MSYSMECGMLSTENSRKAPSGTLTRPTPVQVGLRSWGWGLCTTVTPWKGSSQRSRRQEERRPRSKGTRREEKRREGDVGDGDGRRGKDDDV